MAQIAGEGRDGRAPRSGAEHRDTASSSRLHLQRAGSRPRAKRISASSSRSIRRSSVRDLVVVGGRDPHQRQPRPARSISTSTGAPARSGCARRRRTAGWPGPVRPPGRRSPPVSSTLRAGGQRQPRRQPQRRDPRPTTRRGAPAALGGEAAARLDLEEAAGPAPARPAGRGQLRAGEGIAQLRLPGAGGIDVDGQAAQARAREVVAQPALLEVLAQLALVLAGALLGLRPLDGRPALQPLDHACPGRCRRRPRADRRSTVRWSGTALRARSS